MNIFHRCIKPNHSKVANQFDEELVQGAYKAEYETIKYEWAQTKETAQLGIAVEIIDHETVLVDLDGDEIPADIENIVLWKNDAEHNPFQQTKKTIYIV